MPGKVKVRILAGRNLPVMDRSSDTTDAYVEVKLGNTTHKTDVYRKSLNPQWNSEWFIFEIDDLELQDEPLQIRLMDHDTYSTNDAIGKVYLDLNPLLLAPNHPTQGKNTQDVPNSAGAAVMSGWLPVYDTMHGIRGEVSVLVKVDLFSDFNKFRQSSCGVQFFFTPGIPVGFRCNSIIGFVEELVVNDDPEYKWIDRIRTPRASNEARQTLFSKLSGELQRRIGLKVLEQGGNSVIGYRQCFDLEGESGIVVRGIGSVVSLAKIMYEGAAGVTSAHSPSPLREYGTAQRDLVEPGIEPFRSGFFPSAASPKRGSRSRKTSGSYSMSRSPQLQEGAEPSPVNAQTSGGTQSPTHSIKMTSPSHTGGVYINRRSSDSDLSITPKGGSLTESGGSSVGILGCCTRPLMSQESFDNLIYPFLTMKSFPSGFIIHIGGTVCSRSVQLLDRGHLPEEAETRDCWWSDLRTEIRSHARCLGCNVVIGYEEFTSISDEVCLLNAVGTAAVINVRYHDLETLTKMSQKGAKESFPVFSDKKDFESSPHPQMPGSTGKGSSSSCKDTQMCNRLKPSSPRPLKRLISTTVSRSHPNVLEDTGESSGSCPGTALPKQPVHPTLSGPRYPPCTMCHIPYVEDLNPMKTTIVKCALCRKHKVPDVILATIELPPNIPITGRGCFIQARVIRAKKDLKGEANAREMSDAMPFLEYDLHKQLYQKLMMKGFNAIFALRIRVTIGEKFIVGVGTGTGVFLTALPPPSLPRVTSRMPEDGCRKSEIQKKIQLSFEKNREIYGVNEIHYEGRHVSQSKGSDSEDSDEDLDVDVHSGNKDMYDLDLNDLEDAEMINLLLEENPPEHITVVTTQVPPGFTPERTVNIQMFTKVWRSKLPQSLTRILFSSYFDNLLQSIYFKLRNLSPYIVSGLKFNVGLKEDEVQISLCGMVLGHSSHQPLPPPPNAVHSQPLRHADKSRSEPKKAKQDDGDLIFRMEEVCLNEERPASKTASQKLVTQPVKNVILVSQSNSSSQSFHSVPSDGSAFPSESSAGSVSSDSSSGRPPTKLKCEAPPHPSHASSKSDHFGVEITPLSFIPGAKIEKHLGNLNFFFIRESTNLKESGGLNGFMGSFVTEVLALVRANVAAIGGNAMISYFLSKCELQYNLHKSQGQCLINVGGDIVYAQYSSSSCKAISDRCDASQQPTSAVPTTASASSVFT